MNANSNPASKGQCSPEHSGRPSAGSMPRTGLKVPPMAYVGTAALGCSVERSSTRFICQCGACAAGQPRAAVPTWPVLADEMEDALQVISLGK